MTVRIEPTAGPGRAVSSTRLLAPFKHAAHGDWIFPTGTNPYDGETVPSVRDNALVGPLDAFDATYSADSHTVTIESGEAVVAGAYIGSDDPTVTDSGGDVVHDVGLAASTAGQDVYLGYDPSATDADALIIGRDGAFSASTQPRIRIWSFDTDGSGVTSATSHRPIGARVDVQNRRYEGGGQAVDQASNADTVGGYSPRDLAQFVRTYSFPAGEIPDGDFWQMNVQTPRQPAYLLEQTHVDQGNNAPNGLDAVVVAGDGTELYREGSEISLGSLSNPIGGPWDRVFLRFRLENNTGDTVRASGSFTVQYE